MREDVRDDVPEPERSATSRPWRRLKSRRRRLAERAAARRDRTETERTLPQPAALSSPPPAATPELIGVPVSAIEDFAHNLHAAGVDGSQIAVFAASPALDNDGIAIRFARTLRARRARR